MGSVETANASAVQALLALTVLDLLLHPPIVKAMESSQMVFVFVIQVTRARIVRERYHAPTLAMSAEFANTATATVRLASLAMIAH